MYCLLKAGYVGLDMSGIGISKAERSLKCTESFMNSKQIITTSMFSVPAFSE